MSVLKATKDLPASARSRVSETASFLKRAMSFIDELKRQRFPNASTLARVCGCSRSTAMRTIDRLRYEFGVPIEYDETYRGYFLTRPDFTLTTLPPSQEELLAFCLLADLGGRIGDRALSDAIDQLWGRISSGRSDVERARVQARISIEPELFFSSSTIGLLRLIVICHREDIVGVRYCPPRMAGDGFEYVGRFERVRILKRRIDTVFRCVSGVVMILHPAFIVNVRSVRGHASEFVGEQVSVEAPVCRDELSFFGQEEWAGTAPEMIEVKIAAPAAWYYSSQVWQADQEDAWDGDTLVRRFSSVVSVELVERLLSLGRAVLSIEPGWVVERLQEDVANLSRLCTSAKRRN